MRSVLYMMMDGRDEFFLDDDAGRDQDWFIFAAALAGLSECNIAMQLATNIVNSGIV